MLRLLFHLLFNLAGEAHRTQIQGERERGARLPDWRPRTREEAEEADEDEASLAEAGALEKARQWNKALAIYRELAKYSPIPDVVVKAKMGIKRVKRAQGQARPMPENSAPTPDDEHTTDPHDPRLSQRSATDPRQHAVHYILSEQERAKGFVRPVRQCYVHLACGGVTEMSLPLAESMARDPKFYKRSFCYKCGDYFPIRDFVWMEDDGTVTKERCGS